MQKAGEEEDGEPLGTGIILKRLNSVGRSGSNQIRPGDPGVVRELVQKMCQASHPLAKTMDYLQEDVENMSKEYRCGGGGACRGAGSKGGAGGGMPRSRLQGGGMPGSRH